VTDHDINLTRALQTAGNGTCPAAQGCVLADWFGPDSLSPQALRYIAYTGMSQSAYAETVGRATASGPLFTAPAGPARLMLGLDSWTQSGATTLDPVTAQGNQSGPDAAATAGSYTSTDIYGTLKLPLLKSRELARRLDVSLAARFTATSRYGSFPTLRATMDYLPEEGIRLHAVTGTSRRPPAISEAFGGITGAPQPVSDPCDKSAGLRANPVVNANCLAQGLGPNFTQASPLIDVESGGNTQLRPEQSENEMLGLTLEPPRARWLSLSADYYQYRITHAIDSLADTDPDLIPDLCTESVHLSSPLCGLITRIAGGGTAGQISSILARDENIGTIKTNGLEFEARAHAPATGLGIVTFDWQTNWLLNYRLHSFGQPGFTQYAGTFPGLNDVGSYARVRARATFALERGPWSFGTTARFISGARVLGQSAPDLFTKAPDVIYQDIDITRHFGRLTAMAGIDNLADTRPPTLVDGQTNTDTSTYDVVGRVVWGRVTYAF
jgi:iron complex outermembrane receptor protein